MSDFVPGPLDRSAPFYVAGHRGLVGSAIWRKLEAEGFTNLVGRTSSELDLRNRDAVFAFMREVRPRNLVLAAAKVGGILDARSLQYELFFDEGETRTASLQDYTSENTERLSVDQTKDLLLTIPELAAQLERNMA